MTEGQQFQFYGYQNKWIFDNSPKKICLKGRQIGFTTAICAESLLLAGESLCNVMILSVTERQSIEVLRRVSGFLRVAKECFGVEPRVENKSEVELPNGSRIISLPASPRSVRGYTGHVMLDEFAFHQDAHEIWRAIRPCTTMGYRIRVISTPAGSMGKFYDLWKNANDSGWSAHMIDIHTAMADGMVCDIEAIRRDCTPEDFAQEYECQFVDQSYSLYPYDLIYQAVGTEDCLSPAETGHRYYVGVDVGRKRDLTVIIVVESYSGMVIMRYINELSGHSFAAQRAAIDDVISTYSPARVCIDSTGLGMQLAEELVTAYPGRVESVDFTNNVKIDLAGNLRTLFDKQNIRIAHNDALIRDIHSIKKIVTTAGGIRFDSDRNSDGHADRFWALALAAYAVDKTAPFVPQARVAEPRIFATGLDRF